MNDPDLNPATSTRDVRIACAHQCELGESPLWHPVRRQLFWVDIDAKALLAIDVDDDVPMPQQWPLPESPGCIGLVAADDDPAVIDADHLVITLRSGFFRIDLRDETLLRLSAPLFDGSVMRFNDGRIDRQGRFWAGTIYEPRGKALAGLFCLDAGQVREVTGPGAPDEQARQWSVVTSNGLAFTDDGRTVYQSDTPAHTVYRFDFDASTSALSNRRPFWTTDDTRPSPDYGGRPDGAALDADGRYWSAQFEGARIVCLSPDGGLVETVMLPAQSPTMVAFGGDDLRTLYVTTATPDAAKARASAANANGRLLSLRVDRPGQAPVGYVQQRGR